MVHRIAVGAVVAAALAFAPPAGAAVTATNVSSPAGGAAFDVNADDPGLIVVTGTATADDPAIDQVRIACTYSENPGGSAAALAPATATGALTPTGAHSGTFSVQVSPGEFDYYTCRLRAVPSGTLANDYRPFSGPVARFSGHSTDPPNEPPELHDFYQDISGPLGYWDGNSTSHCFISSTYTLDPASLGYGQLFGCADVSGADPAGTRAALQIDGHDAFLPAEARYSFGAITGGASITGFARRLDPASGDVQLAGRLPTVRCANGATTYPPACPAWTDAGLSDRATTVGDHGGRLVRHTDVWSNPGPVARQLDVWYQLSTSNPAAQWRFPGEAAFSGHTGGDTIPAPPAGPASVLVADAPGQADYLHPRGSVTWSSAPSALRFTASNRLYLHYVRTVAAGGAAAISLAFATDGPQANAEALSADARTAMLPAVAITAPADGATVSAAAATVTGAASDDGPVSVEVNGHGATVAADRTWSVTVPLVPGANPLTATATDTDGNTASAQRTVNRPMVVPTIPPSIQPPPSNLFTLEVMRVKSRKAVRLSLVVPGAGAIRAKLSARLKRPARTVTLAKASKAAKTAGRVTLTLRLSKKALKLLRRRHELKARLSVTFTPTGGAARTKARRVTLRAPRGGH